LPPPAINNDGVIFMVRSRRNEVIFIHYQAQRKHKSEGRRQRGSISHSGGVYFSCDENFIIYNSGIRAKSNPFVFLLPLQPSERKNNTQSFMMHILLQGAPLAERNAERVYLFRNNKSIKHRALTRSLARHSNTTRPVSIHTFCRVSSAMTKHGTLSQPSLALHFSGLCMHLSELSTVAAMFLVVFFLCFAFVAAPNLIRACIYDEDSPLRAGLK
jgi:hypothetical protein